MVKGWRYWLRLLLAAALLVLIPWVATRSRSKHITLLYQGFDQAHVFKSVLPATLMLEQLDGPPMNGALALRCEPINTTVAKGTSQDGRPLTINEVLLACEGDRTYRIKQILLN